VAVVPGDGDNFVAAGEDGRLSRWTVSLTDEKVTLASAGGLSLTVSGRRIALLPPYSPYSHARGLPAVAPSIRCTASCRATNARPLRTPVPTRRARRSSRRAQDVRADGVLTTRTGAVVSQLAVNPAGTVVAAAMGKMAIVVDLTSPSWTAAPVDASADVSARAPSGIAAMPALPHPIDNVQFLTNGALLLACYGGITIIRPTAAAGGAGTAGAAAYLAGAAVAMQRAYKGWPVGVAVSPNCRWAAAGCNDETVHLWQLARSEEPDLTCGGYSATPEQLAWTTNSRYLATGGGSTPTVWDFGGPTGSPAGSVPTVCQPRSAGDVTCLAFFDPTPLLVVGTEAGGVSLFDAAAGVPFPQVPGKPRRVRPAVSRCLGYSPSLVKLSEAAKAVVAHQQAAAGVPVAPRDDSDVEDDDAEALDDEGDATAGEVTVDEPRLRAVTHVITSPNGLLIVCHASGHVVAVDCKPVLPVALTGGSAAVAAAAAGGAHLSHGTHAKPR
jgi:WD40 repeat protein